jgi:hypothetical protein
VRPLLADRGCTVTSDIRLRTLTDVIEHLGTSGQTGIIDGTEIQVCRPAAGRKDREEFISGKNKQNAVKSMAVTDAEGRLLFCVRPDLSVARTSLTPGSWAWSGYWRADRPWRSRPTPASGDSVPRPAGAW